MTRHVFPMMRWPAAWTLLFVLVATATLPIIPVDETRCTSVAWEMWTQRSFLLPILNGEPYADKPPMLFWLIHLDWLLFGVNETTLRWIPGLLSVACLAMTTRIGRKLWPEDPTTPELAATVLAGTGVWLIWSATIGYEVLLTFWALLGWLGILRAAERRRDGWILVALAVAGGLLTKGPVVLLHLLPVALLPSVADRNGREPATRGWWKGLAAALFFGVTVVAIWVVAAAGRGGREYGRRILFDQTFGRMVHSFAHRRPFWWYLPWLPVLYLPWPFFLVRVRPWRHRPLDSGTRCALLQALAPVAALSLISGKQPYYLIPTIPAGALLMARGLSRTGATRAARLTAAAVVAALLLGIVTMRGYIQREYNIAETAAFLRDRMAENRPIAHIGKYYGQFHFVGRLLQPIPVIGPSNAEIHRFAAEHPGALFISYGKGNRPEFDGSRVWWVRPYRLRRVFVWTLDGEEATTTDHRRGE